MYWKKIRQATTAHNTSYNNTVYNKTLQHNNNTTQRTYVPPHDMLVQINKLDTAWGMYEYMNLPPDFATACLLSRPKIYKNIAL